MHIALVIAVLYKNPKNQFLNWLPIQFKIMVQDTPAQEQLIPSNIHEIKLNVGETKQFHFSLLEMSKRGFVIINTNFSGIKA